MAIVKTLSDLIHDTMDLTSTPPDPEKARGRLICSTGTVANAAADSNTSMYHLATLPGRAVVHEDTFFDVENWGFAQVVIGTKTDTDALVDQTKATENIVQPIAIGDANHGKFWWEVLGLAAQPNVIEIWAHAEADATGAGSMPFRLAYLMP
ncbi:hypothetical protein SAMN05216376_111125 [Mameliella alba]|uniref:hypothetical protein n=1 Tax=Mameliella alba TaxID=561184 RepID=UPI00088F387E|nr:hypothetical protein [Mameliella alba]OWV46488.1 hypothetical protein CDZ96_17915 [Mameliella alba]PTR37299.1 hypothetical protein LX94_03638 [Mameliella alba]GGF73637.1 hypothetical protein GCM10011319_37700 [Mameliella alba]SDD76428.1 hypothetical protein SAMN05216376_111125 [Mameliella alba]